MKLNFTSLFPALFLSCLLSIAANPEVPPAAATALPAESPATNSTNGGSVASPVSPVVTNSTSNATLLLPKASETTQSSGVSTHSMTTKSPDHATAPIASVHTGYTSGSMVGLAAAMILVGAVGGTLVGYMLWRRRSSRNGFAYSP